MLLVWLAVALPFGFLYLISRRAVINEVRQHAMGVAIAAAAGLDHELIDEVRGPEATDSPAYRAVQKRLDRMVANNPDIRYLYTMRRSSTPFAPPHALEYVVDQAARDVDGDGLIGPDEISELPGTPYSAADLPAMVAAWDGPSADVEITPDPPYPDLISGYAPIRDAAGNTIAIVGADVTAHTVGRKLRVIQLVIVCVWLLICFLVTLVIHLYYQQRDAFEEIKRLNDELAARHELLRRTTQQLAAAAPEPAANHADLAKPRLLKDTYYLRVAQAGLAPAAVFDIDQDHAGFYLASLSGSSGAAALAGNLVRIALSTLAQGAAAQPGVPVYADLQNPAAVMGLLARLLAKELPAGESVALAYGVLDMSRDECTLAFAGSPFTVLHWQANGRAGLIYLRHGPPLRAGGEPGDYPCVQFSTTENDRIVIADTATFDPVDQTPEQVGSALLAEAMLVRGAALVDQIAHLAEPFAPPYASLLGVEPG